MWSFIQWSTAFRPSCMKVSSISVSDKEVYTDGILWKLKFQAVHGTQMLKLWAHHCAWNVKIYCGRQTTCSVPVSSSVVLIIVENLLEARWDTFLFILGSSLIEFWSILLLFNYVSSITKIMYHWKLCWLCELWSRKNVKGSICTTFYSNIPTYVLSNCRNIKRKIHSRQPVSGPKLILGPPNHLTAAFDLYRC